MSELWQNLDQKEKNNLAAIRYRELLEFLPLTDVSSITDEIRMYAKEYEFNFHSANDIMVLKEVDDYGNGHGMEKKCTELRIRQVEKAISNLIRSRYFPESCVKLFAHDLRIGVLFKISTMIELSNKLKEPVVLRSEPEHCNLELMHGVHKTREQAILEKLLGYSFYVEAKITRNQQIKLYLHQVIETQNGQEKSTLPIANMSIEISDMYDTIGNVLWSASHGHLSSECASSLSFGHYCKFKSKLTVLLREMVRMLLILHDY